MAEPMQPEMSPSPKRKRKAPRGRTVKSSPEAIARHERDLLCVQLRKAGSTWQAIADQLGYASPGHAYDQFMGVMREYPREDVETWRNIISDRYDVMIRALWPEVLRGNWQAVDRVTRVLEAQAKLYGANRPVKIEVSTGESDLDATMRELVAELELKAAGRPVRQEQ